ncbi:hypothetical protein ADM96_15685 [Burkholderia sp. ST111]|nr:hypothetical protein ADM96_15685 [Burkholderia sp. ST111]
MSGNTVVTQGAHPPRTTPISNSLTGTVTNIACAGPCKATIYSAAGVALYSVSSANSVNDAVSIAWTGGPPYITQQTPSSITVSY